MIRINLRDEVERAIDGQWQAFAQRHPHLARAIDREMLVAEATAALSDDPQYRAAMDQAATAGSAAEAVTELVQRLVRGWLGKVL